MSFAGKIAGFIHKHGMIKPGDRIGVAVSGGADSVALLRALLELRGELGCVLAVVHFNHGIRAEAEAESKFVEGLAEKFGLEFFSGSGDARKYAREHRVSLETAARELRYGWFSELRVEKIATAHTLDDQAETVVMKLIRGAGTQGMSGIWPCLSTQYPVLSTQKDGTRERQHSAISSQHSEKQHSAISSQHSEKQNQKQRRTGEGACATRIVRPMLAVRRREVEAYFRSLGQEWCEDPSNRDVKHTRNKVRHQLLPLLEREYNPNIYQQLADAAEVARAEEQFWEQYPVLSTQYSEKQADHSVRDDKLLNVELLSQEPLAVRRRLVRVAFHQASGKSLDFKHTDELVRFLERRQSSRLQLPEQWFAVLDRPGRAVRFEEGTAVSKRGSKVKGKETGGTRQDAGKAGPSLAKRGPTEDAAYRARSG
jgi:tRNA(Ile)-lysidine synthase